MPDIAQMPVLELTCNAPCKAKFHMRQHPLDIFVDLFAVTATHRGLEKQKITDGNSLLALYLLAAVAATCTESWQKENGAHAAATSLELVSCLLEQQQALGVLPACSQQPIVTKLTERKSFTCGSNFLELVSSLLEDGLCLVAGNGLLHGLCALVPT